MNEIVFKKYSFQWACILSAIISAPLIFKRDMNSLLKIVKYAILSVVAYGLFILVCLGRNLIEGTIHFSHYVKFDSDFSSVAGAFALSFISHTTAMPVLKKNANLNNNQRDLLLGYMLTAFLYFFSGFLGSLACGPEVENINVHPQNYSTIFDCVPKS